MEKRTIKEWAEKCQVRLSDEKYYEDDNLYTIDEYREIVPRSIEIPIYPENALTTIASNMVPKDFAKKYRALKKAQEELAAIENKVKEGLKEIFDSISDLDSNTVIVDGIKFTYVKASTRKTVDTKKLQEEYPDIYKKLLKESTVNSSIRVSIEW